MNIQEVDSYIPNKQNTIGNMSPMPPVQGGMLQMFENVASGNVDAVKQYNKQKEVDPNMPSSSEISKLMGDVSGITGGMPGLNDVDRTSVNTALSKIKSAIDVLGDDTDLWLPKENVNIEFRNALRSTGKKLSLHLIKYLENVYKI